MKTKLISGKKNILVTGGAGFIGSHLCEELVKSHNVICIDNFIGGNIENIDYLLQLPNFRFIKHDINQPIDLDSLPELKKFKINVQGIQEIYHLACPTSAKNFDSLRIDTLMANSCGIINVLNLALKYKSKFFLASSSVVYGPRRKKSIYFKEDDLGKVNFIGPRSCYDEGKRFAETCTITYQEVHNLDVKIARVFRTYGPRMPLFDGQMIPDFVLQALNNKSLIIYGDKTFSTSLCYVKDMIDGFIKLMDSEINSPINLGSEEEHKMFEVAEKIISLIGAESDIVFNDPIIFMTPLGLPSIAEAKNKLNWFPLVSLEEGLRKTIEDVKAKQSLLQPFIDQYDEEL
ncbi:MAG: NAD-dependent dehydratase [Parcubacteria group bacterium Athens1014_10]|nr:MAG: NAD-dependent dehydratase [Parcubacteria group bacterium Athens1014_10]TSD04769.1 MAG: NAD-dependent dehydratase [Parcubacteria group bacterium Athens0714_12]